MTSNVRPSPSTETVEQRAINLAFAFTRAEVAAPDSLAGLPDGATITPIPDDDSELAARMIDRGLAAIWQGKNVYFLHVTYNQDGTLLIKRPPAASSTQP
ncbi:MAG TPA: hypothetical protein VFL82_04440 [Thermomicrobiales bacterium]|nr:hypothetical protein [Thermomicrobiales bacterium]